MKNKIKNLVIIILVLLLGIAGTIVFINYRENINLEKELYSNKKINDSIQNNFLRKNKELIKLVRETQVEIDSIKGVSSKIKSIDGILLGDKPISIGQLIDIANKYQESNIVLKNKIRSDSLTINRLKKIIDQLERDKILIRDKDGILSYRQTTKIDSLYNVSIFELQKAKSELQAKNMLLGLIKKNYDIDSEIEFVDDKIRVTLIHTEKLDSALWIYPYYKHKIKTNRKGETVIK
jgi:hypothetical protein